MTTSVVSFVVRKGNPKNIKTWDDLLKPGIKVLTPNPFSSGAAKWNLLAGYGYASDRGKDEAAGLDYLRKLITEHVEVQDKSGREALQNFIGGNGDVLLSYEYEAITANKQGEDLEYVIPDDTIKINIDIATTKDAPEAAGRVPRLRALQAGPGALRELGLPPGERGGPGGQRGPVPDAARACSRSTTSAAGRRSTRRCSTSRVARWRRSRRKPGCPPPDDHGGPHPAAPGRTAGRHRAGRLDALAQPDRPAPAGRRRRALASRAASTSSGTWSRAASRSPRCASRSACRSSAR